MAYQDDILNAAQRRTRTGRSFFPAANGTYRGINYTLGGQPGANAINSTPQSQQIMSSTPGRYDPTSGKVLPPDQNPAYQAAIAKGRPDRTGYTTINLPSGGTASVPIASAQRYLDAFPARPAIAASSSGAPAVAGQNAASIYDPNRAQDITHLQNQLNFPRLYGQGYGNVPPVSQPLNAQERVQRGQSGVGEIASVAAHNILGVPQNQGLAGAYWNFGLNNLNRVASWFGGGNTPSIPPATAAQQPAGVPTPTPPQIPPQYDLGSEPRRYSDPNYNYNL